MKHVLGIYVSGKLWQKVHLSDYPGFINGERITIGRRETCDICIPQNTVSREHAYIEFDGKDVYLKDNGSLNKLTVNGRKHDCVKLKNGMTVVIGPDAGGEGSVVLMYVESTEQPVKASSKSKGTGYFKRLLAFIIDLLVAGLMCIGYVGVLVGIFGFGKLVKILVVLGVFVICLLYFAVSESAPDGSTFGKNIFLMKVVDYKERKISIKRAIIRTLAKVLSVFTLFLPIFGKGRCLHDIIAQTRVVKK